MKMIQIRNVPDELHRSLSDSVLVAKQAAASYTADRDKRIAQLQAQLRDIETLRGRIPTGELEAKRPARAAVTR